MLSVVSCSKICNMWSQFASFTPQGPHEICGILRSTRAGFCLSTLVLLWQLHASHQFIIGYCYTEACLRLITEELDVIPLLQLTKRFKNRIYAQIHCANFFERFLEERKSRMWENIEVDTQITCHKLHSLVSHKLYCNDGLIHVCCVWFIKFCTICLRL